VVISLAQASQLSQTLLQLDIRANLSSHIYSSNSSPSTTSLQQNHLLCLLSISTPPSANYSSNDSPSNYFLLLLLQTKSISNDIASLQR
jgi:hypothetical protein